LNFSLGVTSGSAEKEESGEESEETHELFIYLLKPLNSAVGFTRLAKLSFWDAIRRLAA
jgi:hypothetical protein